MNPTKSPPAAKTAIEAIDHHGLPAWRLLGPKGTQAVISRFGGQLLSWKTRDGRERLFVSEAAVWDGQTPIRGGVPVCFPQFAAQGPLPRHGLLHTRDWALGDQSVADDYVALTLRVADDAASQAVWPHAFSAELTVMLEADRLDLEFSVDNTGSTPFSFQAALHSYLRVTEVEDVSLEGLHGSRFLRDGHLVQENSPELTIEDAIDRIYHGVRRPLLLRGGNLSLGLHAEGFGDIVVWNPWQAGAASMPDLQPQDWRHFLCVEPAVLTTPVVLAPGGNWFGRQTLVPL